MGHSRRVLTDRNGDWKAKVMFVAEAPGRLGADVTGVPLHGDRTGERFEELLTAMAWKRETIFITNAVLCNARDADGNNDKPSAEEIRNCSPFLQRTVAAIVPFLVIALGRVALDALGALHPHACTLRESCGKVVPWGTKYLGVLYHPSPLAQNHRSWDQQISDAKSVAQFARQNLGI